MVRFEGLKVFMIHLVAAGSLNAEANPALLPVVGQLAGRTKALQLVQYVQTSWTTKVSSKTTATFNVKTNDVLLAYAAQANDNCAPATTISGGGLTWTLKGSVNTGGGTLAPVFIWSTTASSTTSLAVTFSWANSVGCSIAYGGGVFTFRNSSGVGTADKRNTTGTPSLNYTTTANGSAVIILSADWQAVDGATHQWLHPALETAYDYLSSDYTVYGGYIPNIGNAGTYTLGLAAPGGQKFSIIAVEVKP